MILARIVLLPPYVKIVSQLSNLTNIQKHLKKLRLKVTSWPLALPVFKMDYAHKEYEARFGREPRAYGVQTMRYDVDHIGNVRGVYTQILEETPEGMVVVDGTERHWPQILFFYR